MTFENRNTVCYKSTPRKKHLVHLVTAGKREYEYGGRVTTAEQGALIFIPDNTRYVTEAVTVNGEDCAGIGICFDSDIRFCEDEPGIFIKNKAADL